MDRLRDLLAHRPRRCAAVRAYLMDVHASHRRSEQSCTACASSVDYRSCGEHMDSVERAYEREARLYDRMARGISDVIDALDLGDVPDEIMSYDPWETP